jgi:hypothetical protein
MESCFQLKLDFWVKLLTYESTWTLGAKPDAAPRRLCLKSRVLERLFGQAADFLGKRSSGANQELIC